LPPSSASSSWVCLASFAPTPTSCTLQPPGPIIPVETLLRYRALPNPSLEPTRDGRHCKPGLRGRLSSNVRRL
jgi:hypothetical protein